VIENCLEIEFESLEACKGKKAAFCWLRQPQKSPKFKFSVAGIGDMTKTSVLSDKNVPLPK
jgi:hypothetical protein